MRTGWMDDIAAKAALTAALMITGLFRYSPSKLGRLWSKGWTGSRRRTAMFQNQDRMSVGWRNAGSAVVKVNPGLSDALSYMTCIVAI